MRFLALLASALALNAPTKFVHWAVQFANDCGTPGTSVTIVANLYPCVTDVSAVFALFTVFEGEPHAFGITACTDDIIYVGVRTESKTLVYMEFLSFTDFLSFMDE